VVGYPPTLTVTSSNATICPGQSATLTAIGAAQYQWAGMGTSNTLVVSPSTSTNYIVAGVGSVACSSTVTITQYVMDCTGISERSSQWPIVVAPNPTSGKITIQNLGQYDMVEVFDGLGQLIIRSTSTASELVIDLGTQSNGVYFVRVTNKDRPQAQFKVLKQ
jgi:hypothetical protein